MKALAVPLSLLLMTSSLPAAEMPPGTELQIRLDSKISSNLSRAGETVEAEIIAPVLADGQVIIAAGTRLQGKVVEAIAAKDPDRAALLLEFGELEGGGSKKIHIQAKVSGVDNARETVADDGRITGILASETLSQQMDKGIEKLGQRSAGLAEILQVAKEAVAKAPDVEITYGPGVEMTLKLSQTAKFDPTPPLQAPGSIEPAEQLGALVNAQPFQTRAEKPPKPSDMTNVMFIGSRENLDAAFTAAGWHEPAALSAKTGLETVRAVVEKGGYQEAPISTLLLDNRRPDAAFEKQNNTFAMRHHLRIWQRPDTFQGKTVWVCAATHDIGIDFSPGSRTFIHKIDSQIDRERAKVVNDLLLTGKVKGLALVPRPDVPTESMNATGDKLETDGSMAVLLLE